MLSFYILSLDNLILNLGLLLFLTLDIAYVW